MVTLNMKTTLYRSKVTGQIGKVRQATDVQTGKQKDGETDREPDGQMDLKLNVPTIRSEGIMPIVHVQMETNFYCS